MGPLIAGIVISVGVQLLLGSMLTGIFLALQLTAGHPQITYYTAIIIFIFGIVQFIYAIKDGTLKDFIKVVGVLIVAGIFAIGTNFTSLWLTYDYGKDSMRGKSELTSDSENKTSGLDKDYILNDYSYGIAETMNLLIPNFVGGTSGGFNIDSETYRFLKQNNVPNARQIVEQNPLSYWGGQRFTAGPNYVGAVVVFLFFLGLFLVKGPIKLWLLAVTVVAILLAWGKNFMILANLFIDYFPGYDKFRTVSMILVIAEFTIPLLGVLALKKIIDEEITSKAFFGAFKKALIIVGGLTLFFSLLPGVLFDFSAEIDNRLSAMQWPDLLIDAMREDRKHLLQADAFRSFIFIVLTGILLLAFYYKKIPKNLFFIILGVLLLLDMWTVNKRYLNNDNFVTKREQQNPFTPTKADQLILQDNDPDFRVLDLTGSIFNSARASYFHKSIGGYHGAKMKRYQELINFQISGNIQKIQNTFSQENFILEAINDALTTLNALNMLNTKYIIYNGAAAPIVNYHSLGHAWFVDKYTLVENADEEITTLSDFNPASEAIIDKRFKNQLMNFSFSPDSDASIILMDYKPNYLTYKSNTSSKQLAVFSEIFYDKGWNTYVDSEPVPHFRVNYVLRAMIVPEGEHIIEFKFEPKSFIVGEKISLVCSAILLLIFVGVVFKELKKVLFVFKK